MRDTHGSAIVLSLLLVSFSFGLDIDGLLLYRRDVPLGTGLSSTTAMTTNVASFKSNPQNSESVPASASGQIISPAQSAVSTETLLTPTSELLSSVSPTQAQSTPLSSVTSTRAISSHDEITNSLTSRSGSITQAVVTTVISISGSSTLSRVLTTSQVVDAASATTSSGAPALNGDSSSGSSSGLSSTSKDIIGGVVGGVGGAILVGGLGVVAWRIWGKRRKTTNDDDDVMADTQSPREKSGSVSGTSPFRANLEQHHASPINTASNF